MVVDDSAVDRRMVGGLLQHRPDFEVVYAEDGMDALRQMDQARPDVVVTDLKMPVKNGLELVTAARIHFSGIPVILITAQGSEELAVEALEQGAASYVPKTQLADKLADTVDEVLAMAHAKRGYEKLVGSIDRTEFDFTLENDPAMFDPLTELFQEFIFGMGLCDETDRFRVGMALKEALLNALYRGNLEISFEQTRDVREELVAGEALQLVQQRRQQEPYRDRRIRVHIAMDPQEARFVVQDDGPGFDVANLPKRDDLSALDGDTGRGIVLMRAFMDDVRYNEQGNEVTLIKRR
jgi:DNA-binding NarL/FixJ family response regulator